MGFTQAHQGSLPKVPWYISKVHSHIRYKSDVLHITHVDEGYLKHSMSDLYGLTLWSIQGETNRSENKIYLHQHDSATQVELSQLRLSSS